MNHYNRNSVTSSLKNYWQILRMHALNKADWDFNSCKRRDIKNVRCWFLWAWEASYWCLKCVSTSMCSLMSMIFTSYLRRNWSSVLTISTFSSTHIECSMIWHLRMSSSELKWSSVYLWLLFSVADCVHYLTFKSSLTSLMTWMCSLMTQWLSVLKESEKLWTISKWTKAITWRVTEMIILKCLLMLLLKLTLISTLSEMMIVTVTVISAHFTFAMRIVTLTMIVISDLKKLSCFFIVISSSASLSIQPLRNSIWSSWRWHFFTLKRKTIIHECE